MAPMDVISELSIGITPDDREKWGGEFALTDRTTLTPCFLSGRLIAVLRRIGAGRGEIRPRNTKPAAECFGWRTGIHAGSPGPFATGAGRLIDEQASALP